MVRSASLLVLSHAPPVFETEITLCIPDTRDPAKTPDNVSTPKKIPIMRGVSITRAPGGIISLIEASVEILTQVGSLAYFYLP